MQWVSKALGSVSQYYKEINPATLSGAIDVIVVERQDEESGETELACSPFHVRFGKLSLLRPVDRKVTVKINGTEAPFVMKVGETGEAYFVFETQGDVPADLQTSPIANPVSDTDIEDGQGADALKANGEPDFLDLNSPGSSATSSNRRDTGSSSPETAATSVAEEETSSSGALSILQSTASKAAEVVAHPSTLIPGSSSPKSLKRPTNIDAVEEASSEEKANELGDLEKGMKADLQGGNSFDEAQQGHMPGDDVREAVKHDQETRYAHLGSSALTDTGAARMSEHALDASLSHSVHSASGNGSGLILDMGGYKVEGDDQGKAKDIESTLLGQELASRTQYQGDDIVDFTQGLLRSADLHKNRSGASILKAAIDSSILDDIKGLSLADKIESAAAKSSRPTSRATSPSPPESVAESAQIGSVKAAPDSYEFKLLTDDVEHSFELSLCGGDRLGRDAIYDTRAFDIARISYETFRDQQGLLNDKNLVVRYKQRYLTWDNAAPVLASLAIYHESLSTESLSKAALAQGLSAGSSDQPSVSQQHSRKWSSWWSRPRITSNTTSSPSPTPPLKSPAEPVTPSIPSKLPTGPHDEVPPTPPVKDSLPSVAPEYVTAKSAQEPDFPTEKHYAKTLRLTSDQLKQLGLQKGMNEISYSISSSYSSNVVKCTSRVFLWESDFRVVISDIDGTITKSDALGHVFTMIGRDWTHLGVAKLYTDIASNGYKMMYLTSRAIGQADTTREYLRGIVQNNFTLPEGPVIMSPDRLMTSLHREVIMRKPEVFKMACLQDINRLFAPYRPFYAGFGNRITDALSYRTVDVPSARIFTIDSNGEVKLELLELTGYKSSYIAMNDLVDQMFPPINRRAAPEYTDFNFWRAPMPIVDLPDFTPPSPTLSARSDSSRYSIRRLTNSITRRSSRPELTTGNSDRQRASSPRPTSPLSQASDIITEEVDDFELGSATSDVGSEGRSSRRRHDSMPGSLEPDNDFDYYYNRDKKDQERKRRSWQADREKLTWPKSREEDDLERQNIEDLSDEEFPLGEMDFSSVPY